MNFNSPNTNPIPLALLLPLAVVTFLVGCSGSDGTPINAITTPAPVDASAVDQTADESAPEPQQEIAPEPQTNEPPPSPPVVIAPSPVASGGIGGPTLDCSGMRIWTDGSEGSFLENSDFFISEGADLLTVESSADATCAIFWEFDAAANCSLAFNAEFFIEDIENTPIDTVGFSVTNAGNLVFSVNGDVFPELPPAGISFEQLFNLPDCPFPTSTLSIENRLRKH